MEVNGNYKFKRRKVMKIRPIILVLVLFFFIGLATGIRYGSLIKWGVESVYADNGGGNSQDGGTVSIPEPSTIVLLGFGLFVFWGFSKKFRK